MRKSLLLVACGAAAAGLVGVLSGAAFASPKPSARPIAPGRSVTATLQNWTSCTLNLSGGTVASGHLTQSVPLVIGPHSSGTWKITGWNAFGDDSADLAVIFDVAGCAQAGSEESYAMQNSDAQGLWYKAEACGVEPAPGLRNAFTAVNAYHATLNIKLTAAVGAQLSGGGLRPQLGACGGLPLQ
jgi:hypothetical protein